MEAAGRGGKGAVGIDGEGAFINVFLTRAVVVGAISRGLNVGNYAVRAASEGRCVDELGLLHTAPDGPTNGDTQATMTPAVGSQTSWADTCTKPYMQYHRILGSGLSSQYKSVLSRPGRASLHQPSWDSRQVIVGQRYWLGRGPLPRNEAVHPSTSASPWFQNQMGFVVLPSHSTALDALGNDEQHMQAMAQQNKFAAGGIFWFIDNNFMMKMELQNKDKSLYEKNEKENNSRWLNALNNFSSLDDFTSVTAS
ncbi:hypothetical protein CPC08DRAFT_728603 [Agrocybe pediades]|nr:hypothetical protein CPC08DRAFT_728603 [Agrocybe pediades]